MKKYTFHKFTPNHKPYFADGFYFADVLRLFSHNAEGMEWYRAEDVEPLHKRIAELEQTIEDTKAALLGKYRVVPLELLEDIKFELSLQKRPLTPDSTSTKMRVDAIIEKRGLFDKPKEGE